jgi:8-amino-7-oxononanoate synthase
VSLEVVLGDRLRALEERGLRRRERVTHKDGPRVACSNLYLGDRGYGAGASRLISGTSPAHVAFERTIAEWLGAEAALLFNSGTQANIGTLSALLTKDDAVFSDALNHASLIDGIRLGRAARHVFAHNDLDDLRAELRSCDAPGLRLIVTEGAFSMDGDRAPLAELVDLAQAEGAELMVDEAHAIGVLGDEGEGACAAAGIAEHVAIRVGTCGKAMGGFGAFVAGSRVLREYLFNSARSFVFSTALPPGVLEQNLRGLEAVRSADLRARLWRNVQHLHSRLAEAGWHLPDRESAVFPIVVGPADAAVALAAEVEAAGFFVQAIRPPTVPAGTSRLRLTASADYDEAFIDALVDAIAQGAAKLGISPLGANYGS